MGQLKNISEGAAGVATQEDRLTRRQMLKTAAGTGLLLLLPMLPAFAQTAGTWTAVGKASDFVTNVPQRATVNGKGVLYITRHSATELIAVSAKCTHRGCEVGWDKPSTQFHCPCHGAVFQADGKNLKGPSRNPSQTLAALLSVPARQTGDQVEVNLASIAPSAIEPGRA